VRIHNRCSFIVRSILSLAVFAKRLTQRRPHLTPSDTPCQEKKEICRVDFKTGFFVEIKTGL